MSHWATIKILSWTNCIFSLDEGTYTRMQRANQFISTNCTKKRNGKEEESVCEHSRLLHFRQPRRVNMLTTLTIFHRRKYAFNPCRIQRHPVEIYLPNWKIPFFVARILRRVCVWRRRGFYLHLHRCHQRIEMAIWAKSIQNSILMP